MSWEMVRLGDLAEDGLMFDGDWIESKDQDPLGDIRLIQLADIGDGYFVDKSKRFINIETSERLKCSFLKKNDILIARMPDPLGRACLFPFEKDSKYITVVDVCVLRIQKGVDYRYVTYAINSPSFRNKMGSQITGTTRLRISGKKLKDLSIPLPPLEVQKQIADTLDKADELRKKDALLLKKYDELAQAIFYTMFGDPVENEKGWEKKKLKLCVDGKYGIKAGPFGSSLKKEFYVDSGYKIYGQEQVIADDLEIGNYYIDETRYRTLETCKVQSGDVLISLVGTYGKVAVVPEVFEEGIINPRLVKITFNQKIYNPYFFKYLFATSGTKESLKGVTRGGTMDIINGGILKELELIVPPIIVQNDFIRKIDYTKKCKELVSKANSTRLFDCLLNKYFS